METTTKSYPYSKITHKTDKYIHYGVFIKNYDNYDFCIFSTIAFDKVEKCIDTLNKYNIQTREEYNTCPKKRDFILAGCEI